MVVRQRIDLPGLPFGVLASVYFGMLYDTYILVLGILTDLSEFH